MASGASASTIAMHVEALVMAVAEAVPLESTQPETI
jgi:hypothetical protein